MGELLIGLPHPEDLPLTRIRGLALYCWPCRTTHALALFDVEKIVYALGAMERDAFTVGLDDPALAREMINRAACLRDVLRVANSPEAHLEHVEQGIECREKTPVPEVAYVRPASSEVPKSEDLPTERDRRARWAYLEQIRAEGPHTAAEAAAVGVSWPYDGPRPLPRGEALDAEPTTVADLPRGTYVNLRGWGDVVFVVQGAADPRNDLVEVASPDGVFFGREPRSALTIAPTTPLGGAALDAERRGELS